jgi:hypothetical protein
MSLRRCCVGVSGVGIEVILRDNLSCKIILQNALRMPVRGNNIESNQFFACSRERYVKSSRVLRGGASEIFPSTE